MVDAAVLLRPEQTGRLRIALHPEHLGELLIDLALRGGMLQGRIQTQTEAAKELILAHLDDLRTSLERQGTPVGDFEVTVAASEDPIPLEALRSVRLHLLDVMA
jgi:flagellar hook-length control protein FliK